ncbi:hypothetical protein LX32DRAFT_203405 [Colletotrichum zoysiae]|uniref:Uncharacterized protein n=1 Tax=Colletotrichum zoysiae TaxID=1216348 RepID=A0AAD9H5M0_9PEZI|nr:hypothetical protein LX32DRAFT_203405 [Colletotrichum zoysiae]
MGGCKLWGCGFTAHLATLTTPVFSLQVPSPGGYHLLGARACVYGRPASMRTDLLATSYAPHKIRMCACSVRATFQGEGGVDYKSDDFRGFRGLKQRRAALNGGRAVS